MRGVLERAGIIHLAFSAPDFPCVIPFNHAFEGERLYLRTSVAGLKFTLKTRNPRVGFNAVVDARVGPENTTPQYQSVSGTGSLVPDVAEKRHAPRLLARRYRVARGPERVNIVDQPNIVGIDTAGLTDKRHMPGH